MSLTRIFVSILISTIMSNSHAANLSLDRLFNDPALSGSTPLALKVAPDGSRVTFLRGKAERQTQLDLWEFSLKDKTTRILVDSNLLLSGEEKLSTEEQARRERARTAALSGIVEYHYSPDGKKLLFPLGGELFIYDLKTNGSAALKQITHGEGFATDPKVSPKGRYVSFIREREVWVLDLQNGEQRAVTEGASEFISNGVAEFIAQEEMNRYTGYWWAPDDSAIAFTQIDESPVPVQRRFEIQADRTDVIEQRYPSAGEANVKVKLGVVKIDHAHALRHASHIKKQMQWIELGENQDIYLARVDWLPNSEQLSFQKQSRDQKTVELVLANLKTGTQSALKKQSSKTWVDLNYDLFFFADNQQFIWTDVALGFKRLGLYRIDQPNFFRALTVAPVDELIEVDEKNQLMYFAAPGDDALQKHVFQLDLKSSKSKKLSNESGMHAAVFASDGSIFVSTHSAPNTPPRVRLFEAKSGKLISTLEANTLDQKHPYGEFLEAHQLPQYGTLKSADEQDLHYALFKPKNFDENKKYPVIVRFYGGPGRQFVTKAWTTGINTGATDLLTQYWLQQGYVVFALDNRGTPRRGVKFEHAIYRSMGGPDIADQIRGIDWLREQNFVSKDRIGVFGWSYGGYIALMLAAQAGDKVAAAVAVAPVTDWALYDTHYTEQYMDLPSKNIEGYKNGTVFAHLDGLRGRLFLIHGMADDNVLFTNTTKLIADLTDRGVQFDLMGYPGGKHGLSSPAMRKHVYHAIDDFFARELKK